MKSIILIISVFLFSCSTKHADINSGLVAHFPFSGNIENTKEPNQTLDIENATLTTDTFGNSNSAYSLNGVDSEILINTSTFPSMKSAKTISWWYYSKKKPAYTTENSAENMVVIVDTVSSLGIQFGYRSAWYNTKGFDCWEWGGGTFLESDFPEFDKWHHCVYTFDGKSHNFFIDNKLSTSSDIDPKNGIPNQIMFGNYPGGEQYFNGKLDDIRIYNRVLTGEEITLLYKEEL